jgi:hypothetical protein
MIKIPVYRTGVMNTTPIKRTVAAIGLTCLLSGGLVLTAATPASAFPDPPVPVTSPSKASSQFYISPGTGPVGERFLRNRTVPELEKVIATRSQFYISPGTGPVGERFLAADGDHLYTETLAWPASAGTDALLVAARPDDGRNPNTPRVVAFTIDRDCPLRRIDRQLLRCDNLTGAGAPAPLFIPEL